MNLFGIRFGVMSVLAFIFAVTLFASGCAPLLIGAGAVGGYHVAKEH